MSDDRIQINFLERAVSGDMADLQALATRQWAELWQYLGARRPAPSLLVSDQNDGTQSIPEAFVLGLEVTKLDANTVRVAPGMLGTLALSPGSIDSGMKIGRNVDSEDVTVPTGVVGGAFWLLIAKVTDVTTVTTTREVFDVPTQTFLPQILPKRVESQVEFQILNPAGVGEWVPFSDLPSAEWEPIAYIQLHSDTTNPVHGQIIDVRRDLRDVLRGFSEDPLSGVATAVGGPKVLRRELQSLAVPTNDTDQGLIGSFWAVNKGRVFGFDAAQEDVATTVHSVALAGGVAGDLVHMYLCPIVSNGKIRVPSGVTEDGSPMIRRGFLASTNVAPTRDGANSAVITLPGLINSDPIPIGEAVHVCSAKSTGVSSVRFEPFVVAGSKQTISRTAGVVTSGVPVWPLNISIPLDLRPFVPKNARSVTLGINVSVDATGGTAFGFNAQVQKDGNVLAGAAAASLTLGSGLNPAEANVTFPVWTPRSDDASDPAVDAYLVVDLALQGNTGVAPSSSSYAVRVLGWEY